jgi:hypothetical protein
MKSTPHKEKYGKLETEHKAVVENYVKLLRSDRVGVDVNAAPQPETQTRSLLFLQPKTRKPSRLSKQIEPKQAKMIKNM